MAVQIDQIHKSIKDILCRNVPNQWKSTIESFINGKIGKLKFIHFISQEFFRMEDELVLQVELWLKQNEIADIKPVWEDNLRTKALLEVLLDTLDDNKSEVKQSLTTKNSTFEKKTLITGEN